MFTGLVETVGQIAERHSTEDGCRLFVKVPWVASDLTLGESIAVNGCCLTVAEIRADAVRFDLLQETLRRTNLGQLSEGSLVNLERAMSGSGRFGGHFVQGHIDGVAPIVAFGQSGADWKLEVAIPEGSAQYLIEKGSIAIDGISLTVAELHEDRFVVWLIPHTLTATNLQVRKAGELVNLEFDLLAKYVERMLRNVRPS